MKWRYWTIDWPRRPGVRYSMIPRRVLWSRGTSHAFITWHGWQGPRGERGWGWTLHFGALKLVFERKRAMS